MDDSLELKGWHSSKNSKVLAEFMKYCYEHPEMRFWEALRNWSNADRIDVVMHDYDTEYRCDTYYKEGK